MKKVLFIGLLIIVSAGAGRAQIAKPVVEDIQSSEKIIKNAPFSADAATESVQILSDGTRITRRTSGKLYRDNEGRLRREDNKTRLGVPGDDVEIAKSIRITDPVSGLKYTLDVEDRTFKQSPLKTKELAFEIKMNEWAIKQEAQAEKRAENAAKQAERRAEQTVEHNGERAGNKDGRPVRTETRPTIKFPAPGEKPEPGPSDKKSKVESLGVQTIEGVQAEGTRTTTTIPAGAIGNDRDINVVYEKWYSKELQMTVFSKHNDPRFGEQTYRLSNIGRDNPPASLFLPPPDYKNNDDKEDKGRKPPRAPAAPAGPKPGTPPAPVFNKPDPPKPKKPIV